VTFFRAAVAALSVLITASACASFSDPDPQRDVVTLGEKLPAAEIDESSLPFPFHDLPAWSLPFDDPPQSLDGILFGLRHTGDVLEFTAVSTSGEALWSTQRPATCSGFTLTYADGEPVAVLTDVTSTDDALAQVTASAYDLHTGEPVWGPVKVEGPWHGPGTVFAQAAPASTMGEVGDKQVLNPDTGKQVDVTGEILGEFQGTILTYSSGEDGSVRAEGAHTWTTPLTDLALGDDTPTSLAAMPGVEAPPGVAMIAVDDAEEAAVVWVEDGRVLTTQATSAVWDASVELVVTTEPHSLAAHDLDGPVWNRGLDDDMRLVASGGVLAFLRSDESVQVVNALTGEDAVGYPPDASSYAVPYLITSNGAAVFSSDGLVLVGVEEPPS